MPEPTEFIQAERALAERLYEAYRAHTGGVSLASGQPIPDWARIRPAIQYAWCASAREAGRVTFWPTPTAGESE